MLISPKPQIDAPPCPPPTMAGEVVVVSTTLPGSLNESGVKAFLEPFVNGRLAACIQRSKVSSSYIWKGEYCDEEEWKIELKTSRSRLAELLTLLAESHPYEEPEITHTIQGASEGYADWVTEVTEG